MRVTAEIRWFWKDAPPQAFHDWFVGGGLDWAPQAGSETRTDEYLVDKDQHELGIKKRGGSGVEIKGMVGRGTGTLEIAGCSCAIEFWAKWPSSLVLPNASLVKVEKRRWSRKFRVAQGACAELSGSQEETKRQSGCDVEVTALGTPDGTAWWTFGFEAFGALDSVGSDLAAVVKTMKGRRPPRLAAGRASGYPSWLASLP
jgi:hypothetical protein